MGLIIFLILVFLIVAFPVIILTLTLDDKNNSKTTDGVEPCPPHKWEVIRFIDQTGHKNGYLQCKKCKKLPEV